MENNVYDQVLSDIKMSKLRKLGLDISDASAYYSKSRLMWRTGIRKSDDKLDFRYTTGDIIKKLPKIINVAGYEYQLTISPGSNVTYFDWITGNILISFYKSSWQSDIDVLFDCLKWCIICKYIEKE